MPAVPSLSMAGASAQLNGLGAGAGLESLGSYPAALQQYSGESESESEASTERAWPSVAGRPANRESRACLLPVVN